MSQAKIDSDQFEGQFLEQEVEPHMSKALEESLGRSMEGNKDESLFVELSEPGTLKPHFTTQASPDPKPPQNGKLTLNIVNIQPLYQLFPKPLTPQP